jgi:hypothetical protein
MRRGVWVVLGLMGLAPVGALAEETQGQPPEQTRGASQERSQGLSPEEIQRQVSELRKDVNALHRDMAALRAQRGSAPATSATGGSGQAGTAPVAGSTGVPTGEIEVFGPVGSTTGGSGAGGGTTTVTQAQSGAGATDDTDTSGIILEIPRGGVRFPGIEGARQSLADEAGSAKGVGRRAAGSATGGSGRPVSASPWSNVPNAEVFVGRVRTVTPDRLLLEDSNQRVYEFRLGERARVVGPTGSRLSLQSLREGTPVRTLTQPGAFENQVIILQTLEQKKAPARCR